MAKVGNQAPSAKKPAWMRHEEANLAAARLLLSQGAEGIAKEWAELFLKRFEWWRERENRRKKPLETEFARHAGETAQRAQEAA